MKKVYLAIDNSPNESTLKELNYQALKINEYTKRYPEKHRLNDTDTFWTLDVADWR